uniref:Putative membrane steroid-binding protein 2 n=1 Tax=Davidia involucrata TaxID=16924 RepID=A0A5B7A777_DAVIN
MSYQGCLGRLIITIRGLELLKNRWSLCLYALFAGKDASRALAKMSFEEKDLTGDISGLGPFELEALQDWEYKFMSKYVKVGTVKNSVPVTDGSSTGEPAEATNCDVAKPAEDGPSESVAVETAETKSGIDANKE